MQNRASITLLVQIVFGCIVTHHSVGVVFRCDGCNSVTDFFDPLYRDILFVALVKCWYDLVWSDYLEKIKGVKAEGEY